MVPPGDGFTMWDDVRGCEVPSIRVKTWCFDICRWWFPLRGAQQMLCCLSYVRYTLKCNSCRWQLVFAFKFPGARQVQGWRQADKNVQKSFVLSETVFIHKNEHHLFCRFRTNFLFNVQLDKRLLFYFFLRQIVIQANSCKSTMWPDYIHGLGNAAK